MTSLSKLAHSADPARNVQAQPYEQHQKNVVSLSTRHARNAVSGGFMRQYPFVETVEKAAIFHDLGKLHPDNQNALINNIRPLPINHVVAGVLAAKFSDHDDPFSSLLVYAHHHGFGDLNSFGLSPDSNNWFPDSIKLSIEDVKTEHSYFSDLIKQITYKLFNFQWKALPSSLDMRMMLSCLVDADHTDTATNYRSEKTVVHQPLYANERLDQLVKYVESKPRDISSPEKLERQRLRDLNFKAGLEADTKLGFRYCNAPVGSGKTLSTLAHALQVAKKNNIERIIYVAPFTNIIDQTVDEYRKAIVLPTEDKNLIVGAVHHKVEFNRNWLRKYSQTFNSPFVVTTSVNFFESLASDRPSRIRKLHNYAKSVIIIDESHGSLPVDLWRIGWFWLQKLVYKYGCHVVLSSGTETKFWQNDDYTTENKFGIVEKTDDVRPLINYNDLNTLRSIEKKRVTIKLAQNDFYRISEFQLLEKLKVLSGPTCLVFNTIHTAAYFAFRLSQTYSNVIHISNALTPKDRALAEAKMKELISLGETFITVCTSVVETGLDISFKQALRERASLYNLHQMAGRVNRNFEYGSNAIVQEFVFLHNDFTTSNPRISFQAQVMSDFALSGRTQLEHCEEYLVALYQRMPTDYNGIKLLKNERDHKHLYVNDNFEVIESNHLVVLVDESIAERIRTGDEVSSQEIIENTVNMGEDRIRQLGNQPYVEPLIELGSGWPDNLLVLDTSRYNAIYGFMLPFIERLMNGESVASAITSSD